MRLYSQFDKSGDRNLNDVGNVIGSVSCLAYNTTIIAERIVAILAINVRCVIAGNLLAWTYRLRAYRTMPTRPLSWCRIIYAVKLRIKKLLIGTAIRFRATD